jgi:hypothetical protein
MRIKEIKESIFDPSGNLTDAAYNMVIKDLETRGVNNKNATQAKNMVMKLWQDGERVAAKYKSIIDNFDIDT